MNLWLLHIILNSILAVPSLSQWLSRRQDLINCIAPENLSGICVPLSFCPHITNLFAATEEINAVQYLIAAHQNCGAYNIRGDLVVCCTLQQQPQSTQWSQLPPETYQPETTLDPVQPSLVAVGPRNPFLPELPVTSESSNSEKTTTSKPKNPFLPPYTTTTPKIASTTLFPQKPNNPFLPHVFTELITTTLATTTAPTTTSQIPNIAQRNQKPCDGPYPKPGVCISIKECPPLLAELKRVPDNADFRTYLRSLNDICDNNGYEVCCQLETEEPIVVRNGGDTPTKLLTPEEGCGHNPKIKLNKIVGGEPSAIGGWPWIALLGYKAPSGVRFLCGGTLITGKHVLTAAHCIRRDLVSVRLGEHDLSRDDETTHMDFKIIKLERHPEYNSRIGRADLGVLYLEKNVQFSDLISPICLPLAQELRSKVYVKHSPFVVGWGKTMEDGESSNVLLQLSIPIHENELCRKAYEKQNLSLSEDQFDSAIVCAGTLSGGKDTCQGDSGGPLMVPENYNRSVRFYLIGVVSYGIGCARPEIPAVYASTQYFLDWIIEKVAETQ